MPSFEVPTFKVTRQIEVKVSKRYDVIPEVGVTDFFRIKFKTYVRSRSTSGINYRFPTVIRARQIDLENDPSAPRPGHVPRNSKAEYDDFADRNSLTLSVCGGRRGRRVSGSNATIRDLLRRKTTKL